MDLTFFDSRKPFLKGNLHCHTTVSDGALSPQEAASFYKGAGYDFIAITDHNVFSDWSALSDDSFTVLPGCELSVLWYRKKEMPQLNKAHHLLFFPLSEQPYSHLEKIDFPKFYGDGVDFLKETQKTVDSLKDKNCLVCLNHPSWSRILDEDILPLRNVDMVEVYNHGSEVYGNVGHADTTWQKLLDSGMGINAIATDDNHNGSLRDSFGGFVCVNTDQDIIMALKEGRYYSSTGPAIHNWGIAGTEAWIECEECDKITLRMGPEIGMSETKLGEGMTFARLPIHEDASYIRFEINSRMGMAWTNPFWLPT